MIFARVLLVSHADQRRFEQPHHRSEHLLAPQAPAGEVTRHLFSNFRQRPRECDHALVFVFIAHRPPILVVTILLPAANVPPGGLNVTVGVRTDPDFRPRGWNRQMSNPREGRLLRNSSPSFGSKN